VLDLRFPFDPAKFSETCLKAQEESGWVPLVLARTAPVLLKKGLRTCSRDAVGPDGKQSKGLRVEYTPGPGGFRWCQRLACGPEGGERVPLNATQNGAQSVSLRRQPPATAEFRRALMCGKTLLSLVVVGIFARNLGNVFEICVSGAKVDLTQGDRRRWTGGLVSAIPLRSAATIRTDVRSAGQPGFDRYRCALAGRTEAACTDSDRGSRIVRELEPAVSGVTLLPAPPRAASGNRGTGHFADVFRSCGARRRFLRPRCCGRRYAPRQANRAGNASGLSRVLQGASPLGGESRRRKANFWRPYAGRT